MNIEYRKELGPLVTFVPNKRVPIYSWFYYKEGFSRDFVLQMFKELEVKENDVVLDPFMGVGTSLLASREVGNLSYGFDVSDIAVFVSKVKTRDYEIKELKKWRDWLFKQKFVEREMEFSGLVKAAFKKITLLEIVFFRDLINTIDNEKVRDFFLLALMTAANKCSYAFKDGAVIKIRKRPVPPIRPMLKRTVKKMISDVRKLPLKPVPTYPEKGDARSLPMKDECVNFIITSPPYLNKIEYTQVYSIENELFFGKRQQRGISSAIGLDVKLSNDEILSLQSYLKEDDPLIAYKYFKDMKLVLDEMYRVLTDGGRACIVIGNGCFPDRVIESDVVLARMAEDIGFVTRDIWVANQRWCMRDRVKKVGPLRESVLVIEK